MVGRTNKWPAAAKINNSAEFSYPLVISIASLLLMAAIKNDAENTLLSEFFGELETHPLVAAIKANSSFLIVPMLISVAYAIKSYGLSGLRGVTTNSKLVLLCSLPLFAMMRLSIEGLVFTVKPLAQLVIFAVVGGMIHAMNNTIGPRKVLHSIFIALVVTSLAIVGLNLFNVITGNGYVPSNARLFGTSAHPNFLGVILGVCGPILFYGAFRARGLIYIAVLGAASAGCLYLIYCTGSRTSLIVFAAGAVFGVVLKLPRHLKIALFCVAVLGGVFYLLAPHVGSSDLLEIYDRGENGANNRGEGWSSMFGDLLKNPLLGYGNYDGFTINSLLRGWVSYGILWAIAFGVIAFTSLRDLWMATMASRLHAGLFLGLLVGIYVGSVTEGYLVDTFSFPLLVFAVVVLAAQIYATIPSAQRAGGRSAKARIATVEAHAPEPSDLPPIRW